MRAEGGEGVTVGDCKSPGSSPADCKSAGTKERIINFYN